MRILKVIGLLLEYPRRVTVENRDDALGADQGRCPFPDAVCR